MQSTTKKYVYRSLILSSCLALDYDQSRLRCSLRRTFAGCGLFLDSPTSHLLATRLQPRGRQHILSRLFLY
jgi:hypothetical protein